MTSSVHSLMKQLRLDSNQAPLVAGALTGLIALTLAITTYFYTGTSNILPALDEAETEDIMDKMLKQIKLSANNMLGAHANIKQQIMQQGQQMSDRDIMVNYIFPHFETQLSEIQTQVLNDYDVELCEIEEAVNYYETSNQSIGEIVFKIKTIYKEMGGEVDLEYAAIQEGDKVEDRGQDLSIDQVLGLLRLLSQKMVVALDGYADAFIDEHGIPTSTTSKQNFQLGMMTLSEEAQKQALDEFGLKESDLQRGLMENQTNEDLQKVFFHMQLETQNILMGKGISLE